MPEVVKWFVVLIKAFSVKLSLSSNVKCKERSSTLFLLLFKQL